MFHHTDPKASCRWRSPWIHISQLLTKSICRKWHEWWFSLKRGMFWSFRSQTQVKFWNKTRRIGLVLTTLTNPCPYPQGKCLAWSFTGSNRNNTSRTLLVRIQMQIQVCWLEDSYEKITKARVGLLKAPGLNFWCDDKVNETIALIHYVFS